MINTWKFLLRADLPSNSLANLNFCVFGLGDSSYELFNAMAKKLTARLLSLGATQFHDMGLGDYQHDFEYQGEFDPWLDALWPKLSQNLNTPHIELATTILPSIYNVEI